MKTIQPSSNEHQEHQWPRHAVKSVDCRRRDLVIRITDWTRDREEPAFDVEAYVGGVYDWSLSESFLTRNANQTKQQAKAQAIAFAQKQIAALL